MLCSVHSLSLWPTAVKVGRRVDWALRMMAGDEKDVREAVLMLYTAKKDNNTDV